MCVCAHVYVCHLLMLLVSQEATCQGEEVASLSGRFGPIKQQLEHLYIHSWWSELRPENTLWVHPPPHLDTQTCFFSFPCLSCACRYCIYFLCSQTHCSSPVCSFHSEPDPLRGMSGHLKRIIEWTLPRSAVII